MGDKDDLTRIENMEEFVHEEDEELNEKLDTAPTDDELAHEEKSATEDSEESESPELDAFPTNEEETPLELESEEPSTETDDNLTEDSLGDEEPQIELETEDHLDFSDDSSSDKPSEPIEEPAESEESSFEGPSFDSVDESADSPETSSPPEDGFPVAEEEAPTAIQQPISDSSLKSEALDDKKSPKVSQESPPTKENFNEIIGFAQELTYGKITRTGNPPYSILIKNINSSYKESIISLLDEHGLADNDHKEMMARQIDQGSLLISQLSEYTAIYLANKLRRFQGTFEVGLSHQIHPPQNYDPNDQKGSPSLVNLDPNRHEDENFFTADFRPADVILTTGHHVANHSIKKYLGIVSEEVILPYRDIKKYFEQDDLSFLENGQQNNTLKNLQKNNFKIDTFINDQTQKLQQKTYQHGGNALINIVNQIILTTDKKNRQFAIFIITGTICYIVPHEEHENIIHESRNEP